VRERGPVDLSVFGRLSHPPHSKPENYEKGKLKQSGQIISKAQPDEYKGKVFSFLYPCHYKNPRTTKLIIIEK
jgi:hypothetical protein